MGRIKRGLDYFPMSTDFIHDRMVRRIMKHEGDSAFVILIETFSYIYSGKGYYVSDDDEFYDELADNLYNTDIDDVKRIITLSVEYGLFDATLFREYQILTSADVQRQYLFITKRRSGSLIEPDYCLLETEEVSSFRTPQSTQKHSSPQESEEKVAPLGIDPEAESIDNVADKVEDVADRCKNVTSGTQNKRKQTKEKQSKENLLLNPPQGGNERGNIFHNKKVMTQEDIDNLQAPNDGVKRNFQGLVENLRLYKIPPSEQYAIVLKSNFGAIGNPVWKGFMAIYDSCGKIKLPGHYLLSVIK